MAQVPSPETKSPELPTIIIDPSLYEPEKREVIPAASGGLARLTRVTIAVTAVGAATYGISQMGAVDSILRRTQVSALTSVFSEDSGERAHQAVRAATPSPEPARLVQAAEVAVAAPEASEAALAGALPPIEEARAVTPPPPAKLAAALAVAPTAVKTVVPKPAAAEPASDAQAVATKTADKGAAIEGDVRNARRLLALNRLDQAEAAYRKVLSLKDDEPSALTGLARVQLARGQLDDALSSAMRAVAEAPKTAGTHLTLGDVLRARGDKSGAQAHYDEASQLKPIVDAEP
jgi:predicted negative regulator of RcsB-dependent stress response